MRYAASQLPDALHLLRLVQLSEHHLTFTRAFHDASFQFFVAPAQRIAGFDEVGDVGRRSEPARNFSVRRPHRYRTHLEPAERAIRTMKPCIDIENAAVRQRVLPGAYQNIAIRFMDHLLPTRSEMLFRRGAGVRLPLRIEGGAPALGAAGPYQLRKCF